MGFSAADYEQDADVWPENWTAWRLFTELSGQWRRAGMSGTPVALDYTALFMRMDRMRLDDEAWQSLFDDVRVIEAAALDRMKRND